MISDGLILDMPNDTYHGLTDWISSTQLKRALPERTEPDDDAALRFGSLFHAVVLEPERVALDYVVLDAAKIAGDDPKTGKPYINPTMTSRFKAAAAEAAESGKVVVDQSDWDKAHLMAESVRNHQDAAALLFHGEGTYEESAFWTDENGVQHKARFDRRIPGAVVDLKSTSTKLTDDKLSEATLNYGYDVSAVHYLTVANGLGLDVDRFWLVFVSKSAPYHVQVRDLDHVFLALGAAERERAIDLIVNGQRGTSTLTPPRWARIPADLAAIPADFEWSPDAA